MKRMGKSIHGPVATRDTGLLKQNFLEIVILWVESRSEYDCQGSQDLFMHHSIFSSSLSG